MGILFPSDLGLGNNWRNRDCRFLYSIGFPANVYRTVHGFRQAGRAGRAGKEPEGAAGLYRKAGREDVSVSGVQHFGIESRLGSNYRKRRFYQGFGKRQTG